MWMAPKEARNVISLYTLGASPWVTGFGIGSVNQRVKWFVIDGSNTTFLNISYLLLLKGNHLISILSNVFVPRLTGKPKLFPW